MSKALAFYFMMFGVYQAVGALVDRSAGPYVAYTVVTIVTCFALAAGMYGRYRIARMAGIGICTVMTGATVFSWCESGFQFHVMLFASVIFGLPLIGLLHPKARTEFTRKVPRIWGR